MMSSIIFNMMSKSGEVSLLTGQFQQVTDYEAKPNFH